MVWMRMKSWILGLVPTALRMRDLMPVEPWGIWRRRKMMIWTVSDIERTMYNNSITNIDSI